MPEAKLDLTQPRHARADGRLRNGVIVWLGSVRPDGRPHLVPVWFLWDGSYILIFSKPDYKIRNLQQNRQVVLALDDSKGGNDVILIEGEAELPPRGEVDTTLPAYAEKYAPQLKEFGWTAESMSQEYTEAIRITPTKFNVW